MERGQYALEFGSPAHALVTPEVLKRVEALQGQINTGKFGALPATHEAVEPFLQANSPAS
jgi:hypothetical protein